MPKRKGRLKGSPCWAIPHLPEPDLSCLASSTPVAKVQKLSRRISQQPENDEELMEFEDEPDSSASNKKLRHVNFDESLEDSYECSRKPTGYRIFSVDSLSAIFERLQSPCCHKMLTLGESTTIKWGLGNVSYVECSACKKKEYFSNSFINSEMQENIMETGNFRPQDFFI